MEEGREGAAEAALEEHLAKPAPGLIADMAALEGDLLVLGAGGKMGPSLARMAVRASREAGVGRRVIAVSRFAHEAGRSALERHGVVTLRADLLEPGSVAALPDAPNIVFMVGQKFGTTDDPARTWAVNAWLPGVVAERFAGARIVAFSTGNVYPLAPVDGPGPGEHDATGPIGGYAWSALAREQVLEFFARRDATPMAFLRVNYAVEPRYGVLRDIADRVRRRQPVSLAMGWVNCIWQADANAVALRALGRAAVPPLVLNVTGRPALRVRWLAEQFARRWGLEPTFEGTEAGTALLSDASRMAALFGPAETSIDVMIDRVASWVEAGGRSLDKPTHFEEREGRF